jgi:hypothetical protein
MRSLRCNTPHCLILTNAGIRNVANIYFKTRYRYGKDGSRAQKQLAKGYSRGYIESSMYLQVIDIPMYSTIT